MLRLDFLLVSEWSLVSPMNAQGANLGIDGFQGAYVLYRRDYCSGSNGKV